MSIHDVTKRVQRALEEFDSIEPTRYALAHWLTGAYREAVVGHRWPAILPAPTEIGSIIADAKVALARARGAARSLDGSIVEVLPERVHVTRVRDASGAVGFAPIELRGAALVHRVLDVLLADYLMRPEAYVGEPRSQETTLPELDLELELLEGA